MGRNRVLSFMSQFSGGNRDSKSPSPSSSPTPDSSPFVNTNVGGITLQQHGIHKKPVPAPAAAPTQPSPPPAVQYPTYATPNPSSFYAQRPATPPSSQHRSAAPDSYASSPASGSPINPASPAAGGHRRTSSRPLSMVQTYSPPLMDINEDTIPELQPIFTFLNSHANKLYQEGYFLKLDDQNSHGRPNPDRTWTECFAQLVGTVLSLWDAAELDAAGEDGEVLPKFINLTDASIKMIESLPTRSNDEQPLQNILSISTAGRNRYLLHFNSHHSLIQWTAGIRLAMYEHSTLQEAYTGALIAGKGKTLNNIGVVMERSKWQSAEWVRVRFGAGVPWRRCWCVVTPPDEKEYQKQQKELKKKSPYKAAIPQLKGDIKFYDTKVEGKKLKKVKPIASITDSYSAYAIYPQAKSLIDASTLLKIEGNITIHSDPPSSTEGFVFIMPEVHPMVSGFEMLLRFLFPTWDTFGLYGRPGRLVASVLDARSLMFAMPKHKRYGYLEILDVTGLILTDGSATWTEREWRRQLKELTGTRMNTIEDVPDSPNRGHGRSSSRRSNRLSISKGRVGFADDAPGTRTSRSLSLTGPPRMDSAPPALEQHRGPPGMAAMGNMSHPNNAGPYGEPYGGQRPPAAARGPGGPGGPGMGPMGPHDDFARSGGPPTPLEGMRNLQTPEPVSRPPAFNHGPKARPVSKPYHSPELRMANSRLSNTTLSQLVNAAGAAEGHPNGPPEAYSDMRAGGHNAPYAQPSVPTLANDPVGMHANDDGSREALTSPPSGSRAPPPFPPPLNPQRSRSPMQPGYGPPGPGPRSPLPPHPPPRGGPPPGDGHMRPPQAPYNNFSRPDGARTPPISGPGGVGRVPTPEMRGRSGPPSPLPGGPQAPAFQNSRPQTPNGGDQGGPRGAMLSPLNTSPPVNRKPLGGRPDEIQTASSGGSFTSNAMNQAGLGQVRPLDPRRERTPQPEQQHMQRQFSERSGASSRYDDASSATSPDYASTHKSSETQESMDRPRAGVLKTVGGAEPPMPQKPNLANYDLPDVNFGPTVNYGASKKTPQPIAPGGPRPYSPALRSPPPTGGPAADAGPRQMAWHPGAAHAPSGQGVSAEQYVQSRAAMGGHTRTPSGQLLNSGRSQTPSPSMGRSNSQELLSHQRRKSSVDLLSRPGSRGANHMLDQRSSGDMASHLSAREQEQIARMTGGPLINMGGGRGQQPPQQQQQGGGGGLVGAIDARERERQQMKQGFNSQAVQHAIHQRQQQQYQQQMQQQQIQQQQMQMQMQQQGMYPPNMGPNMGRGGPPGPGPYGQPRPQQQPYGGAPPMSPGHGAFPRGPMPMRQGPPPSPGPGGPQGFMPPQAPYGAPGPRPQSPGGGYGGRGGPPPQGRPPYQGQAF